MTSAVALEQPAFIIDVGMTKTDWRGNQYGVGSTILYPRGLGSHGVEIAEAVVLEIEDFERTWPRNEMTFKVKARPTGRKSRWGSAKKDYWLTTVENITAVGDDS